MYHLVAEKKNTRFKTAGQEHVFAGLNQLVSLILQGGPMRL